MTVDQATAIINALASIHADAAVMLGIASALIFAVTWKG
jgi:hypothetical protein